ncbi:MAG: 3-deoxy-7-phosphoheptulonate synthase [Coriobacteriia bacterium]|nr:3-deoxy-7-phosphoheptulonate synthase [Coriobacteriia bacterium]
MIIILKPNADAQKRADLCEHLVTLGLDVDVSEGQTSTVLGLVGDTSRVDMGSLRILDIVEDVKRVSEPYKKANRKFHPCDSVIAIGEHTVGGDEFALIAGPCSVESREQMLSIAADVARAGATALRGGAYKPRTSPYAFQGMREEGIEILLEARAETGLPIVTELMDVRDLPAFSEVDVVQIGARNMQNFALLKEVGALGKPVLLKRGLSATIEELLMSAEYIMAAGNEKIILCERGIRTFETATRNTLDLSAIPVLKELTHLPIVVDPSHATGVARYVRSLSLAALAAGADGLIVEVHNDPPNAQCDGAQSITPEAFAELSEAVNAMLPIVRGTTTAR